jgi:hypothetical protein
MSRNSFLLLAVCALAIIGAVLGYQLYEERRQPDGVQITVGPGGVSIEKK